jgi:hypothetical protein
MQHQSTITKHRLKYRVMKQLLSTLKYSVFCFIFYSISVAGMCSKEDVSPDDNNNDNDPPALDQVQSYVAMKIQGVPVEVTNEDYEFKASMPVSGTMRIYTAKDTIRCIWIFTVSRVATSPPLPQWQFCDASYQSGGTDEYIVSFEWSRAVDGDKLIEGKTYNLNYYNVPLADTRGTISYSHFKGNSLIKHFYVFDYFTTKSWLKIETIEGNKASGTFLFSFGCIDAGGSSSSITNVSGRFNNIPVN